MCAERRAGPALPRLVLGLSVALVGLAFLLDEMGRFDSSRLLLHWPLVPVAFGLAALAQPRERGEGRIFGGLAVVVGLWFEAQNLGWLSSNPLVLLEYFWPAVLIAAGTALVWRSLRGPRPAVEGANSADRLRAFVFLSGVKIANVSQNFVGGYATAVMGGCDIDLRQAKPASEEVVIDVFALWGGIDIKVPEDWLVVGKVIPILGGFEAKAKSPATGTHRLVVTGSAIMGGVEVHT